MRVANGPFGNFLTAVKREPAIGRSRLWIYLLVLGATALAAIWRNLTTPFWLDETFTGAVSCQDGFAAMMPLIRHDVHPVLYHILIHLMFGITGCHLWLVRCLSVSCALGGAFILVRQAARMEGNIFLAMALTLGNPTFWLYAFEARAYGMLFLAGCGVVVYGLSDRPNAPLKAIAFALLGGMLHYYASFLFVALFLVVVCLDRPVRRSRSFWLSFAAAGTALVVYYALQLPTALKVGSVLRWIQQPHLADLIIGLPSSLFGNMLSAFAMMILGAMIVMALLSCRGNGSREGLLLTYIFAGLALLLFGASFFKPMFIYRYLHFLVPALIMGLSLLARDAATALALTNPRRAASFTQVTMILIIALLAANLEMLLSYPLTSRVMGWQKAMASMSCTRAEPCGFVMDDPVLPTLTPLQYTALANFLANEPGSFVAIQPAEAASWIQQRPGAQILYVQSFAPVMNIKMLVHVIPLTCRDYRQWHIGAMACQSQAAR